MNNDITLLKSKLDLTYMDASSKHLFVYKFTSEGIETIVAKFVLSKKKNNIKCTMTYCTDYEYLKESVELVKEFIKNYSDIISEDK